jgi:hypothetical protein
MYMKPINITASSSSPWIQLFIRYMLCKYFLPLCGLPFHFLALFFKEQMFLIWIISIFTNFFLYRSCFFVSEKSFVLPKVSKSFWVFFLGHLQFEILHLDLWPMSVHCCTCCELCGKATQEMETK